MLAKISSESGALALAIGGDTLKVSEINWGTHKCPIKNIDNYRIIRFADQTYKLAGVEYINLYYDQQNHLRMGPFMGMLISRDKKLRVIQGFSGSTYIKLARHMHNLGGILVFFTIDEVDWSRQLVAGHILGGSNSVPAWVPVCVPLPRVIYDRSLGADGRSEGVILRQKAGENQEVKIFNFVVKLGKLETYDTLVNDTELRDIILPYSSFSMDKLELFIEKYGCVYLKPNLLYKGEGLIKITREGPGQYTVDHHRLNVFTSKKIYHLQQVEEFMEDFGEKSTSYVIQKGIDLARFLGNPFDVRVMLQKNCLGQWEVTGQVARVGAKSSPITSPRGGGKVISLEDALLDYFVIQEKVDSIIEGIDRLSKKIGDQLEKKYGLLGELGIDLGIDRQGGLWLIEVNGKPLKVSIKRLKNKLVDYKINSYPPQFGSYLDGYRQIIHPGHTGGGERIIELTSILSPAARLNPDGAKPMLLKLGSKELTAPSLHFSIKNISKGKLAVSGGTLAAMGLPEGLRLRLLYAGGSILWLGPVMAVMKSPSEYELLKRNVEYRELEYMEKNARDMGILLFYFTVQDIDWEKEIMLGVYFNRRSKKWEESSFPLPDIIFDLGTFPRKELRQKARLLLKRFNQRPATVLINNRRFFGKHEIYEAMSFLKETREFTPATSVLSEEALYNLAEQWPRLFVKSEYGSHGYEVICIERKDSYYKCEVGGKRHRTRLFKDFGSLYQFVSQRIDGRPAIIQQGIELLSHENKIFDLRIIVQKNKSSRWGVDMISLRQAPSGCAITNISIGGKEIVPRLNQIGKYIPDFNLDSLTAFSVKCALAVECYFGPQGVLGLDVGLDKNGRPWLFEVNSKPSILGYIDMCGPEHSYRFYSAPILYGLHKSTLLTGASLQRLHGKLAAYPLS